MATPNSAKFSDAVLDAGWEVMHGDARSLPLPDASIDLICTSPPYWGQRSYRDGGEHYSGQVGSEPTPQQYVDELVGMIDSEWRRVLKPSESLWLNLGDKYAGSGGHNNAGVGAPKERGPSRYIQATEARPKSLLGLPERVKIALIDRGWICRATVIWDKANGLPESVTDRVRASHEYWYHFTLEPRYYAAVDRIREPLRTAYQGPDWQERKRRGEQANNRTEDGLTPFEGAHLDLASHPLGRLPGSVRSIATQPFRIPDEVKARLNLPDHYAAFPMEWPRWIIEGWCPEKVCVVCGEGRRPVTAGTPMEWTPSGRQDGAELVGQRRPTSGTMTKAPTATIVGEACACPDTTAPSTPGVVLDPFGGTGTTAGVAHILGRHGISVDLSADYCRLAQWRIGESGQFEKWYEQFLADQAEAQLPGGPLVDLLCLLPGIGRKTAHAIIDSGIMPLRVNADLTNVAGVGRKTVGRIRNFLAGI